MIWIPAPSMIKIDKLFFSHPGRSELYNGLYHEFQATENVLLTGSNGCGKSTLLKLIMGMLRPRQGVISIAGKQISGVSTDTFQSVFYQDQHTGANLLGINPQHDWEIWRIAIPTLPENPFSDTLLFSEMSGGMQKQCSQRILPYLMDKFWILDEPFASLDKTAAQRLAELLFRKSKTHPGMLIVSHEHGYEQNIFGRILRLHTGQISEGAK